MGCGGSKSDPVASKGPLYHHVPVGSYSSHQGQIATETSTTNRNVDVGSDNSRTGPYVFHSNGVSAGYATNAAANNNRYSDGLPHPKPPTSTREELLEGKQNVLQKIDQHAMQVNFDSTVTQNLGQFTTEPLIPKDVVTETQTTRVIQSDGSENQNSSSLVECVSSSQHPHNLTPHAESHSESDGAGALLDRTNSGRYVSQGYNTESENTNGSPQDDAADVRLATKSAVFPVSSALDQNDSGQDSADAAEMLLEKYKKDKEIQDHLMKADKMRQNATLQEKLAKRREKKKRALEQGMNTTAANPAVGIGAANEDGIIGERPNRESAQEPDKIDVTTDVAAVVVGERQFVNAQDSIALADDTRPVGDVSASQDKHTAVMAEPAPLPAAPETRKEAIYRNENNIELFKDLEDFAVNMEQISSPRTTFALLMEELLINQLSDLEKVRILFHWITKQDLNTINFPSNLDEDTPMGFLHAIKFHGKSYSELFSRLCSAAGLHAKVIQGYVKGVGYIPEYKFKNEDDPFRGNWNAVLINGQWRLIDTHWGARHILEDEDSLVVQQTTIYRYEEHYFLTNPDQLIMTHFPYESSWQLLQRPITLDQFQDTVKLWPLYYKMKLTLISPVTGLVTTSSDGTAEFRFHTTDFTRKDGELKCELRTKDRQRKVGDKSLDLYTFHYRDGDLEVFRVFCPAVGDYILKIFGHSNKFSEDKNFTNVAIFQINCPKLKPTKPKVKNPSDIRPDELIAPFPQAHQPWGPPGSHGDVRILAVSHTGPIISCDRGGEATLVLKIIGEKTPKFLQQMYEADGKRNDEKEAISNRAVSFITSTSNDDILVVFRMRTPGKGIYSLNLFAQTVSDDSYNGFCNYLIASQAQTEMLPEYPDITNGVLGASKDLCRQLDISPVSTPPLSIREIQNYTADTGNAWMDGENDAYVSFDHAHPLVTIAQLEGADNVDLSGSVLVQDTGNKTLVVIRPPKKTRTMLEVGAKIFVALANQSSNIPVALQAIVTCRKADSAKLPQSPVKRWGPDKSAADYGLSLRCVSNTSPLFNPSFSHEEYDPSPCRLFTSGDYIVAKFALNQRLKLRPLLSLLDQSGTSQQLGDENAFTLENNENEYTVAISIPSPGNYNITLLGTSGTKSEEYYPLYFMLIQANAATNGPSMPRPYPLWMTNMCQLRYPRNKNLKRNTANKVSVKLARRSESQDLQPFPKVVLLTDQSQAVHPNHTDPISFTYEWDYVPGPGEKVLSLVAQKDDTDNSYSYVLQFEVVD